MNALLVLLALLQEPTPASPDRAVREAELLREARRLERAAGKDLVRQVAYADWCLSRGLIPEGLTALDRVLSSDSDQRDARALLERSAGALGDLGLGTAADSLDEFCVRAARAGPVVREIAIQRLERMRGDQELESTFERMLSAKSPRHRSFGALALRRLFPGAGVRSLLGRAVLDSSGETRHEAALALRDVGDAAVAVPVLRALGSRTPEIRLNAIQALSAMNYPATVEPLYRHLVELQRTGASSGASTRGPHSNIFVGRQFAYVQDFDVEVAQNQAIADPVINVGIEGAVLDASVLGVHEYALQTERAAARTALERLTGADPGNTTQAWMRWWKEHGADWQADASPTQPASSPQSRER